MNTKRRTIRGFTLIELVVAVGLLSMVLGFAGVIFKVSIEAQRTAGANAEIMQKLRAITDQLNRDFKGIRKNAPLEILFEKEDVGKGRIVRHDGIAFLGNGDFQSVRLYDYGTKSGSKIVAGNVASIYYGQAAGQTTLIRKQRILTFDDTLDASPNMADVGDVNEFLVMSLAEWNKPGSWTIRRNLDTTVPNDLVMYMAPGVDDLSVQVVESISPGVPIDWWPEDDDIATGDSKTYAGGGFPRAIKFSFRLYDSKRILKGGRAFTYIVYIGD